MGLPINLSSTQYCMDRVGGSVVAGWPGPIRYLNLLVVSVRLAINYRALSWNIDTTTLYIYMYIYICNMLDILWVFATLYATVHERSIWLDLTSFELCACMRNFIDTNMHVYIH